MELLTSFINLFSNPVISLTIIGLIFEFVPVVLQFKKYGWPFKPIKKLKGKRPSLNPKTEGQQSKDDGKSNFYEFVLFFVGLFLQGVAVIISEI